MPDETSDDARRLRGRLASGVTVWTAGQGPNGCGLTVANGQRGYPVLVDGVVEDAVIGDLDAPLAPFRGHYRRLADPPCEWGPRSSGPAG